MVRTPLEWELGERDLVREERKEGGATEKWGLGEKGRGRREERSRQKRKGTEG